MKDIKKYRINLEGCSLKQVKELGKQLVLLNEPVYTGHSVFRETNYWKYLRVRHGSWRGSDYPSDEAVEIPLKDFMDLVTNPLKDVYG